MNKKRLFLFKVLAVLSPLLLLVLLEGALRLFGSGHDMSLFTEDPGRKGYLVLNKYASEKYFSRQQNATIGNFEPFLAKKAPGIFRIFVLGESTTIGYPYMHNGSFHRWLQYRLMHTYPDRDFEVINLSLTAVNSHTVLDFAKGVLDYEPDAVLVYTGHNEYYGAMGIGATGAIGNSRLLIRLLIKIREFRLVQLISVALSSIGDMISGEKVDLRENLMKRMAADQQIPYGSAAYQAGIDQFTTNIDELCKLLSERKVPLLISNLVSNEKDLKPFISISGGDANSADMHYQNGVRSYAKGNYGLAKKEFVLAKELDALRFRAPEVLNARIREIANHYESITVVDSKSLFEKHSVQGILGKETLLEHVHPNLYGYALLSEAFYQAMKNANLIPPSKNEMSSDVLRKQMPITPVDSLKGAYEVMILKEGWPFNIPMPADEKREKTVEEKLAGALVVKQISWREAMNRLQKHYAAQHDTAGTLKVAEALVLENPLDVTLYDQAGKISAALNKKELAVTYLSKAFRLENSFERARQLFVILLKMDRPEDALPYVAYAAANNPSVFNLSELHTFVQQLAVLKRKYASDSTNVMLSNQLATGYLKFANAAAAEKYIRKTLDADPKNTVALGLLQQVHAIKK